MASHVPPALRCRRWWPLVALTLVGDVGGLLATPGAAVEDLTLVSAAASGGSPDGPSIVGDLTADGAIAVFTSSATDLLPGAPSVPPIGVYVRDLAPRRTQLLLAAPAGQPRITADGAVVVAIAPSGVLWDSPFEVIRVTRATGAQETISRAPDGSDADSDCLTPQVSDDGTVIAYMSDAGNLTGAVIPPGMSDIFVADLRTHTTTCISRDAQGRPGTGACTLLALSGDGRFVAFSSTSATLPHAGGPGGLYLVDRVRGTTIRVDCAPDGSPADGVIGDTGACTPDGEVLVFSSTATNLVAGPHRRVPVEDVFRYDRSEARLTRVSATPDRGFPDDGSFGPAVARQGEVISYLSYARDLAPSANGHAQAYAVVAGQAPVLLSAGPHGVAADADCFATSVLARDGQRCLFATEATNLLPGDASGELQVYAAPLPHRPGDGHEDGHAPELPQTRD